MLRDMEYDNERMVLTTKRLIFGGGFPLGFGLLSLTVSNLARRLLHVEDVRRERSVFRRMFSLLFWVCQFSNLFFRLRALSGSTLIFSFFTSGTLEDDSESEDMDDESSSSSSS